MSRVIDGLDLGKNRHLLAFPEPFPLTSKLICIWDDFEGSFTGIIHKWVIMDHRQPSTFSLAFSRPEILLGQFVALKQQQLTAKMPGR